MRHTRIQTPAPLEEAYPFEDGESWQTAVARHGDRPGPRSMRKATRPEYNPQRTGPKGQSRAY